MSWIGGVLMVVAAIALVVFTFAAEGVAAGVLSLILLVFAIGLLLVLADP